MTAPTTALALGKTCAACGKERKSKVLKYDPQTFLPYCENPYICNDDHPNSPKNLILNQKETPLVDFNEINEAYKKHLMSTYANSDLIAKIHRMLTMPTTLRIQDPDMAKFLIDFEAEQGLDNMSDTIRHCIQLVKDNRGAFFREAREAQTKVEQVQAAEAAVKELESPKKPTKAKPEEAAPQSDSLGVF